jgi:hypothetical protein
VAGERNEGLEAEAAGNSLDLLDQRGIDLGRMAAGLQQGQHQRGEFMPHWDAGEADARRLARQADREGRLARIGAVITYCDQRRQGADVLQQGAHFGRFLAAVEGRDEFDGLLKFFEVSLELCLDCIVEHGISPQWDCTEKALYEPALLRCNPAPGISPGSGAKL